MVGSFARCAKSQTQPMPHSSYTDSRWLRRRLMGQLVACLGCSCSLPGETRHFDITRRDASPPHTTPHCCPGALSLSPSRVLTRPSCHREPLLHRIPPAPPLCAAAFLAKGSGLGGTASIVVAKAAEDKRIAGAGSLTSPPPAGAKSKRPNPPNTELRRYYERSDLPLVILQGARNKLQWKVGRRHRRMEGGGWVVAGRGSHAVCACALSQRHVHSHLH